MGGKINMKEKCGKKKAIKAEGIIYGLIFLLALFLRVYRLNDLPYGIHMDEAGMGYDAYSLANWGLDRYYKFYPVYFINFGGGQSVLYGYSCAFLLKFFKLSVTLLRTPAVISGMMTWLFGNIVDKKKILEEELELPALCFWPFAVLHPDLQIRDGLLLVFWYGVSILVLSYQSDTGGKEQKSNPCFMLQRECYWVSVFIRMHSVGW